MKFDYSVERIYPATPEAVWRALTEPAALGAWLMETDFVAAQGREFRMWCQNSDGGTDLYLCECLLLEPCSRMLWSWILDGRQEQGQTLVEFRLEAAPSGTRLIVRHRGDRDPATIDAFRSGWPHKLELLAKIL